MDKRKNNNNAPTARPKKQAARARAAAVTTVARRAPAPPPPRAPAGASDAHGYARAKTGQMRGLTTYMEMILDPHRSADQACRYPDETIVPTGIVSLQDSISWQVPAPTGSEVAGTVYTALKWKTTTNDATTPTINEFPISVPSLLDTSKTPQTLGAQAYEQQNSWLNLSSVDRSLALGIRVRLIGLPNSTFLPSGTLYFLQYQNSELLDLYSGLVTAGESVARACVSAKKGFSCTVNELSKTDGVTVPYLPQGPMSFVFSDSRTSAAVNAGLYTPSTVVSANGGVLVVGFGLQEGQSLRIDYGHVIEYIPRAQAAGLIQTAVQPPSSAMRDAISTGAAAIQQTISGATNLSSIARVVAGGAMAAATSVARGVVAGFPGGPGVIRGLGAMAEGLGAPSWLRSAIGALA